MSDITKGMPAFPRNYAHDGHNGMTLRDYFAIKALIPIYMDAMKKVEEGSGLFEDNQWRVGLAIDAYLMADAMLKARTK